MGFPSAKAYIAVLAILVSAFGAWTVHSFEFKFWQGLLVFLGCIILLVATFLVHWSVNLKLIKKREERRIADDEAQLHKVNEELRQRKEEHEKERHETRLVRWNALLAEEIVCKGDCLESRQPHRDFYKVTESGEDRHGRDV